MSGNPAGGGHGTTSRILDVAERLLQVRGYNGFSYGDVAAELGITRAALHYHFRGKAELGQALVDRYADRFGAALDGLDARVPDAAARLHGYVDLYTDVLDADRMCLCGMLAAEHRTLPESLQQAVCAFFTANTAWLTKVFEQGRADGSLGFVGTAEDTAAMVLGALQGAMLIARLDGDVRRFVATAHRLLAGLDTAVQARHPRTRRDPARDADGVASWRGGGQPANVPTSDRVRGT